MNQDEIFESWKQQRQSIEPSNELVARLHQLHNRPSPGSEKQVQDNAGQSRLRFGLSIAAVLAASVLGIIRLSVSLLLGIQ